jgi:rhodanese-related sulfurtransferase
MMNDFFKNIGLQINGIIHLSPKEAYQACIDGALIVDVREEFEILAKQFDVKNIIYIPKSVFKENYKTLPKDKAVIIADAVGLRSKEAVIFLQEKGYNNIALTS